MDAQKKVVIPLKYNSVVSFSLGLAAVNLDGKLGVAGDYTRDGLPRTLLLEYCRYGRDSALDVFENNYRAMILDMQNGRKVSAFELEGTVPAQG